MNRKFTEEELIDLKQKDWSSIRDYEVNDSPHAGTIDRSARAELHNNTWDFFVEQGITFNAINQNSFQFEYRGQTFLYYPTSNKWSSIRNRNKTYRCRDLRDLLSRLDKG